MGRRTRYDEWVDAEPYPGVELRKVPGELAWTLHDDAGVQLGRIERKHLGRGGTFWAAYGIHPELGREVPLELSAVRDERIASVLDFRSRPDAYRQHWRF